jgi:hypothetical protein
VLFAGASSGAQELEPRAYSPSLVGANFVLGSVGRSAGEILFEPLLDVHDVEADLWVSTFGFGRTFDLAGRQARVLAVFPAAWGAVTGDVGAQPQRRDLSGLVDPRLKLTVGLFGAPAMTRTEFAHAPQRTTIGASVTIVPPWGQYDLEQLVNLGYNRWAFKPEIGVSRPLGRWTLEGYAGVWLFTTNTAYYPGVARRKQDAIVSLQAHVARALPRRIWVAFDATWFAGGVTRIERIPNSDYQRNTRLGVGRLGEARTSTRSWRRGSS